MKEVIFLFQASGRACWWELSRSWVSSWSWHLPPGAKHSCSQGRAGPAEPRSIYPRTTARAQLVDRSFGHVCKGNWRSLAFMELDCFQTGICHKFIDALIELSEARERYAHSTPPLLKVGTSESGPSRWNKLPHSLLLDMRFPVQSCCAPETLSGPMTWWYAFQTHAPVRSWFRKCFSSYTMQLKQTITSFSRENIYAFIWNIYALNSTGNYAAQMEIKQSKNRKTKSLCQISKKTDMLAIALPRIYKGRYKRLRMEIERYRAVRDEKKGYHTGKKCSLYRLLLSENWKWQTKSLPKYNTQHSDLAEYLSF